VSDVFREVEEEVRREQLKKLWERYGPYVVALAVLALAAVGGWRVYEWRQGRLAAEAGSAYVAATLLSEQGKHEEAEAAYAKLAKEGPASYRVLAGLRAASELARGDSKAGVAAFDALAGDTALALEFRDLASLRAGYVLVDTASHDEMRRRIEPLTAADRPYRHSARALLALAAWRANDAAAVRRWFEMILSDAETPPAVRSQAEMLMTLLAAEGKS
jgi:hypothetical protein